MLFFVGDGMGVSTVTAARVFSVGVAGQLVMDQFPYTALSRTYSSDSITADSAPNMSAMMTGVNTNQSVFGFGESTEANDFNRDGDGDQPWTLLELAKARGMKAGAVSTARLTHATPAAAYAHVHHRDKESAAQAWRRCRGAAIARFAVPAPLPSSSLPIGSKVTDGHYDRYCNSRGDVVMISRAQLTICLGLVLPLVPASPRVAADLQSRTVAAFDRYVAETERQREDSLKNGAPFLWIEAQRTADPRASLDQLRAGAFVIERLTTASGDGKKIEVPDGLIHHWLGAVFVPGVSIDQGIALLQDYDRHATIYAPAVAQSKILARDGDSFRVLLRFFMKKVITVVVDGEHQARFTRLAPDRAHSRVVSTRLNEVEDPGTERERLKPEGRDGGYLWRINSYWRFLERDGGTYVQCETITLSRRIPIGLGWIVGPFVTSIPKDSLEFTLTTTRQALLSTANARNGRPR